jgi:hypothetical protein
MSRIPHISEPLFDAGTQKVNDNWLRFLDGLVPVIGTWTPVLTFATPGDLSVTYSSNSGTYVKIGNLVIAQFVLITSAFTHTTASGDCQITGLPFASGMDFSAHGSLLWAGVTKAGYTAITARVPSATSMIVPQASGSGVAVSNVAAADMPTAGSVVLAGTAQYTA